MDLFGQPDIRKLAAQHDVDGLHRCLEHRNPVLRLQAAQALAEMNLNAGWQYLTNTLQSDTDPVQQEITAEIMGEIGHPRAVPALSSALRKARHDLRKKDLVETIRQALETIGGPEAEEALRQAGFTPESEEEIDFDEPAIPFSIQSGTVQFQTAEQHLNNAVDLREAELAERGLVESSLALWLKPDWAYAWYVRGVLFEDLERPYEALLSYRRARDLDVHLEEANEALEELQVTFGDGTPQEELVLSDLASRSWQDRRDAASAAGALGKTEWIDLLVELLQDNEREVRHAAIDTLGALASRVPGDRRAVLPLLELTERSWLLRFSIIQALSNMGSVEGLLTVIEREMERIQERNPIFTSQRDPLLEVEYDLLMEVGVRALERTGDIDSLILQAENNTWEIVDVDEEEDEEVDDDGYSDVDTLYEEFTSDSELSSYVDETAHIACIALERLALSRLDHLSKDTLQRLANVPDLTLVDLTGDAEEQELTVVYDLSNLRAKAAEQLTQNR